MIFKLTDEEWIDLGIKFCNLKTDFKKKYFYKQKELKKTKAKKYYDNYYIDFIYLSSIFDSLIQKSYPSNQHYLTDKNHTRITDVFYSLGEQHDCSYFNGVEYNDVKTNDELFENYKVFMGYAIDKLQDAKEDFYKGDRDYLKLLKYNLKLRNKLLKRQNKGYRD